MSKSPIFGFLRAGPPPPKIALLPDGLFFTRAVPITPGATPAEAAGQIELALEAVSPFPLAQLYYGWFHVPGAERAFVFAAYRRRFTAEQTTAWGDAELVIPAAAALFGLVVEPATTVFLHTADGLTAVHWGAGPGPEKLLVHPFDPETTDEARAAARDELVRALGGSRVVIDAAAPPLPDPSTSDREIVFRSGEFVSRLPAANVTALDVRDKNDLAGLRNARRRDIAFWRVALGCAAALVLLGLGEIGLVAGQAWERTRQSQLKFQKPLVDKIMTSQELANRIDDLATKRLLPFEMLTAMVGTKNDRLPADITFTRILSTGLYSITVEVQTNNPGEITVYQQKLRDLPEFQSVEAKFLAAQGDKSTFRIDVTFKPGVLKPEKAAS